MANNPSRSELFYAVEREDWIKARTLLRRSDARDMVEYTDGCIRNAIHRACYHRAPPDVIQAMLNISERAPLQKDMNEYTPLHYAIEQSSEEIMIKLIEACPRAASIADDDGNTPLHLAIDRNRSSNIVRRLLAANPTAATAANKYGVTPLRWFSEDGMIH